jgi:RimJ/RimL family protein N-acetyltransferase
MHLNCGLCIIRDWTPGDRDSLLRVANNRNIWRNLTHRFPHPYTAADADLWLSVVGKLEQASHWAVEVDGEAVGGIGVERGEGVHVKSGHFGYWLGEPYWGHGIMTAAVRATSDYILDRMDIVRLEAPVFEWNPASMRVLEKCGFIREGVLRRSVVKDGEIIDAVLYARVVSLTRSRMHVESTERRSASPDRRRQ